MDTYKAIICDFDSTLVGREMAISEPVQRSIRSLKNHGFQFVIASGRSYVGPIKNACRDLDFTAPQITRGGAEIIDPSTNSIIHAELIPDQDAAKIIQLLNVHKAVYFVEKDEYAYHRRRTDVAAWCNRF